MHVIKLDQIATITVRKTLQGVGVERVFPLHAPCITSIQVLTTSTNFRAKLYYLRKRTGKATRLKEKFETLPDAWSIQDKKINVIIFFQLAISLFLLIFQRKIEFIRLKKLIDLHSLLCNHKKQ